MTDNLSLDFPVNLPVSFRILGIGDNIKPTIDKIEALEYEGVSASIISQDESIVPNDEDRMVIILVDEYKDAAKSIAKGFYQAGVLTLIMTTTPIFDAPSCCDSQSISDIESMYDACKAILDILTKHGYICLDFNDIYYTLSNSGYFKIIETIGNEDGSRVADALSKIGTKLPEQEMASAERIIISIFFNRDMQPPLTMSELKPLDDFLSNFSEEIITLWAIFHDDKIRTDEVRLYTIISGKNLKP